MAELIDLKELEERVILIAVNVGDERETSASLDELEELAQTAGAVPIARIVQNREAIHPGTYLGKGKILEVRELLADTGQRVSSVMMSFLGPAAQSGRCAGYKGHGPHHGDPGYFCLQGSYKRRKDPGGTGAAALPGHPSGRHEKFSFTSGRRYRNQGTGREKLETDRRLIHQRIGQLKRELEDVKRHREVTRQHRGEKLQPDSSHCGIYQCGKIHSVKPADRSRDPSGKQAFCDSGSHYKGLCNGRWTADPFDGYGRIYP